MLERSLCESTLVGWTYLLRPANTSHCSVDVCLQGQGSDTCVHVHTRTCTLNIACHSIWKVWDEATKFYDNRCLPTTTCTCKFRVSCMISSVLKTPACDRRSTCVDSSHYGDRKVGMYQQHIETGKCCTLCIWVGVCVVTVYVLSYIHMCSDHIRPSVQQYGTCAHKGDPSYCQSE